MQANVLARARRHLIRCDPVLADVIRAVGPCRWGQGQPDLFAGLVRAIISQQLSVKAADTIHGRVLELLPDGGRLHAAALRDVPHEALRSAGLSARKAEYLRDLCGHVVDGTLHLDRLHALDDDEVVRALTAIRGIGQWTAEMMLMFRLHRPDVLPLDDVGLQRAVQRAYGLRRKPTAQKLIRLAEPWRPWRTVACWYLWATLD